MAQQEEIVLWIDRRWRVAIEKQLQGETLQEHLDNMLDELYNRLPDQEYTRISNEIQEEARIAREAVEAARTYSAYRVMENGEARYFKVSPGEELLAAAQKLRHYLKDFDYATGKFIGLFKNREPISPEEFQQMTVQRMENTGKVAGAFDIDFDKREFSAVHIMDGWKTWAMHDVSVAAYHAGRKEYMDTEKRWQRLLDHLEGKELTSAGHLSAREFTFGDEIVEHDEKLNFYVQAEKNYGKEGAEIICDNCQDTIFGGFSPQSKTAEALSSALGSRTVLSGSVSQGKDSNNQSLQMMERPLMTPDELKSIPKGEFVVMKTGTHPMRTKLRLFLDWGITFDPEGFRMPEQAARKVAYANKEELISNIRSRYPGGGSPYNMGGST